MRSDFTVVLEGADGAGKTTLARALQARYGLGYQHAGPPPEGATPASLTRTYLSMLCALHMMEIDPRIACTCGGVEDNLHGRGCAKRMVEPYLTGTVVDRWALGETIYGPLFRGRSLIGPAEWRALVAALDATRTPLVVCLPDRETCLANWQQNLERETFKDRAAMLRVYDAYASWALGATASPSVRPRWMWVHNYRAGSEALFDFLDDLAERSS